MAEHQDETAQTPLLTSFDNEDDLFVYLARLNEDGHDPQLASIDAIGISFLATLTDPDADRVHHVVTSEEGRAHCTACCACEPGDTWGECNWRPRYPVTAISWQNPLDVRAAIATAEREEAERHATRIARARAELSTPPGAVTGGDPS